jgi:starch-binding outer membrane protein, SusD/RagB family
MRIIYILFLTSLLFCVSCDDMLEPGLDGTLSEEGIWSNNLRAFGFLNNAYHNLPDGYNRISGAMPDAATDDAVCPDPLNPIHGFYNGNWSPYNIIDNVWFKNYEGIRKVNTFLLKIDDVPLPKSSNALGTDESILRTRERMKGEAYFLRAYFYFELLKRFGGVPLTSKPLTPDEATSIKRSTLDECFEFIIADCDSAALRLPRKYGAEPVQVGYNDAKELGRATSGAAKALKSRALLYLASPLFNPENDQARWNAASEAAKEVIDYTVNEDGSGAKLYGLNRFTSTVNMTDLFSTNSVLAQYHQEIVFSTQYINNTTPERLNAPISFGAKGMTNPTQNLVDAFPMSNGKPINDPTSGYDPLKPYNNRDPRLAMTVLFNGSDFTVNDKTSVIETYSGGNDGPESYPNASSTGYYLKKFLLPHAVWDGRTVNITRTWILIRFAELYLNYAESRNEAFGPDAEVYAALRALRLRAGIRPSDVQSGLNKEQMRRLIQNERRIELAFEEHRFFDIRRWKLFDDPVQKSEIQNIRAVRISRNEDGSFNMDLNHKLQERTFTPKMYFFPIPMDEIQKNKNLVQNPMW